MAGRGARETVSLACSDCKNRNYKTTKLPAQTLGQDGSPPPRLLEIRKFCKQCKKHTVHRETK